MVKKIILSIVNVAVVLIGISFLSFALLHLAPGNPAEKYLTGGDGMTGTISQEAIQAQEEKWGLDKPFFVQYLVWLGNAFRGDLGDSYTTGRPVVAELLDKIGPTVILSVAALFVTLLISIPLGVLCALYKDRLLDNIVRGFSFCGISLPSFLTSLLALYIFGVQLKWISVSHDDSFVKMLFPMAVLAFQCSAKFVRQVRAVVLEQMGQEYVRGAVARGQKIPYPVHPHPAQRLASDYHLGGHLFWCSAGWGLHCGNHLFLAGNWAVGRGIGKSSGLPHDSGDCSLDGFVVSDCQFPGGSFLLPA